MGVVARQLVAIGCVVTGVWLLVVDIVDTDLVAIIAVALVSILLGVYQLRRRA